ncbi:hypothetical protein [Pontibaca methylaminivorans]|uniref:hypothetical protein n=1 Tax=Pontibaca methylaminivorans TaxID=515897 RepID=UPI00117FF945|nr:hypothetical protein [Pontibaca methylaminivorans]
MMQQLAQGDIVAHRFGFNDLMSAEDARRAAIQHGISIIGIHGAIWPAQDQGFCEMICKRLIDELVAFSIYARRFMEISNEKVEISGSLHKPKPNVSAYEFETDLWKALNLILHSRYLQALMFDADPATRFSNLGDRYISFVEVRSDKEPEKLSYICPTGLVVAFFSTDRHFPTIGVGEADGHSR